MLALQGLEPLALLAPFLIKERLYLWCGAWPVNNFNTILWCLYKVLGEVYNCIFFWILQGSDQLVLPLVIMGAVSVLGGLTSLRLPETLHHRLPQTVEEGEEFGKDWSLAECFQCVPPEYELCYLCIVFIQEKNNTIYVWYTVIAKTIRLW